jgi:hypothetical protein
MEGMPEVQCSAHLCLNLPLNSSTTYCILWFPPVYYLSINAAAFPYHFMLFRLTISDNAPDFFPTKDAKPDLNSVVKHLYIYTCHNYTV